MRRRHWLAMVAVFAAGCSSSTKPRKKKGGSTGRARLNKGPQTMEDLAVVGGLMADLASGSDDAKIKAAESLGKKGAAATSALPELKKLVGHKNPRVSAAAKAAVAAIEKASRK